MKFTVSANVKIVIEAKDPLEAADKFYDLINHGIHKSSASEARIYDVNVADTPGDK